jgi:hypothetical protein
MPLNAHESAANALESHAGKAASDLGDLIHESPHEGPDSCEGVTLFDMLLIIIQRHEEIELRLE